MLCAKIRGVSHASLFPTEMIYRHTAVMDGEMVHFEILDTAGQVRSPLHGEMMSENGPKGGALSFQSVVVVLARACVRTRGLQGGMCCSLP